ncbi:MAG: hypothetical protein H7328_07570 [Bdellovibrio sp.]|nr:hypothetical protein [Bdellovibrio sp.]
MSIDQSDVQLKQYSDGLTKLLDIINSKSGVFDLNNNVNDIKKNEAIRLLRSLDEYNGREKSLIYLGFLGHYSTGKSSTINSILNLQGESARPHGLDRTDKQITLITKQENLNSLILMVRTGDVPIRISSIESDLLKNIVLMDTPGSGDPSILNELVRDILPVCDYLFYFISAANPLDDADLPLLKEKSRDLKFIPMKVILTRANEFAQDENEQLTETNFNEKSSKELVGNLIAKFKEFASIEMDEKDVFLIDNKACFRIEALREFIIHEVSSRSTDKALQVHSHKVNFFKTKSSALREHFFKIVISKIEDLGLYLKKAEENKKKYEDSVNISNNNLTNSWFQKEQKIKTSFTEFEKAITETAKKLTLPENIWQAVNFIKWQNDVKLFIHQEAVSESNLIIMNYKNELKNSISMQVFDLKIKLSNHEFDENTDIGELLKLDFNFKLDVKRELHGSTDLNYKVSRFWHESRSVVKETAEEIKSNISTMLGRIRGKYPLKNLKDYVEESMQNLNQDIDKFFSIAELYRTAILSRHVKDYINNLNLGKNLDDLDQDFLAQDKLQLAQEASNAIYFNYELKNSKTEQIFSQIENDILNVKIQNIVLEDELNIKGKQEKLFSDIKPAIVFQNVYDIFSQKVENRLLKEYENITQRVSKIYIGKRNTYLEEIDNWKKDTKKLIKNIILLILTTVLVLAITFNFNMEIPQTIFWVIITTIISGTIFELYKNYISLSIFKNFVKSGSRVFAAKNKFSLEMRHAIDEIITDFDLGSLEIENSIIYTEIEREWSQQFETLKSNTEAMSLAEIYTQLNNISIELRSINLKYSQTGTEVFSQYLSYYNNPESNISHLNGISNKIKINSIEPSFLHLQEVSKELNLSKENIGAVVF